MSIFHRCLWILCLPGIVLATSPGISFVHMIAGNSQDRVSAVALGPDGSVYIAGLTNSSDFEITPQAARKAPGRAGGLEGFVRRLSSDGQRLIYSTYLGPARDGPVALAVDGQGSAFVAMYPELNELATYRELEPRGAVGLVKLPAAGDQMSYRVTILPEGFYAPPLGLAVDGAGAVYVAAGNYTVAAVKIEAGGQRVEYRHELKCSSVGTMTLGGLALGRDRSLYLVGSTNCPSFPATANAYRKSTANPQNGDGFAIRLNPAGADRLYATLLGGEHVDSALGVVVDALGRAMVVGSTVAPAGPMDPAPMPAGRLGFSQPIPNRTHGFLLALNSSGSGLDYTQLLPVSSLSAVALDTDGNSLVGGVTDAGIALGKVSADGQRLLYFLNPPAARPLFASVATDGKRLVFGGTSGSLVVPDRLPSTVASLSALNGFAGAVSAEPPVADLFLEVSASAARPDVFRSVSRCRYRLTNLGPAAATDILLLADAGTSASFQLWSASPPIFIVPTLASLVAGPRLAAVPRLEPGASAEIEFISNNTLPPEGLTCTGVLQGSTSETRLENNSATAQDRPPPMVRLLVGSSLPGVSCQRDDWPVLAQTPGIAFWAPVNGTIRLFCPSPQDLPHGPAVFRAWVDGSTENPRSFTVGDTDRYVSVSFALSWAPLVDAAKALVNAASFLPGPVSPGEIVVLGGFNLGPRTLVKAGLGPDGRLVRELAGVRVLFDGEPAPFIYASFGQTSVVVPYGVRGKTSVRMVVENQAGRSEEALAPVAESAPGLFALGGNGLGQAAALNQDHTPNGKDSPAKRGEVVTLYGTGEGLTEPLQADGSPAVAPYPKPVQPVSVKIGDHEAKVLYAGSAPGLTVGLLQVNVQIPDSAPTGNHVPVVLTVGNVASAKGVTLAIR